jgi:hypothetical protein
MRWLGVGNVEGWLYRGGSGTPPKRESLLLRGGVVGYRLPPLRDSVVSVKAGDVLIFATDGIAAIDSNGLRLTDRPAAIADGILARFARGTDDALVLVGRYDGEAW